MVTKGFKRRTTGLALAVAAALGIPASGEAQGSKPVPYWASLSATEARMRVGPSLDYPSSWIYRRRDLPVKVIQVHGLWRKVEDSTGTQGWMHVRLLSDTATAIITAPLAELRAAPQDDAKLLYRAEAGVVGRIADCDKGWCSFDVRGQRGYVRADTLWGATR